MKKTLKYLLVSLLACSCACSESNTENPKPNPEQPEKPEVGASFDGYSYTTTADKSKLFKEEGFNFGKASSMSPYVVKFTDDKYQTVDGFGAALTVSSCYNILKMDASARAAFLKDIFDPEEGVGSSLIRICIGGSDFSWDYGDSGLSSDGRFTWCDAEGMENFAAHPMDVKYVLPVLKEILSINPAVKIIGSPWTAPRWMKLDSKLKDPFNSWTGGRLNPKYYQDYASYFVKWIQYMKTQGIDIYAITPENEPLNAGNSMSMLLPWEDCRDFIKTALGPAFESAGIKTKILIFDHNYNYDNQADQEDYPLRVYADPDASKYIAGSAWHNYGGNVSELDQIVAQAPDKEIYFTEASIGTWNYTFAGCLINDFRDIMMGTLARGGKGVTFWNLVLDDKKGPYTNAGGSCTTCYAAAILMTSDMKTTEKYTHYYNFAHCSKVIRPGAVRIGTAGYTAAGLSYQAYRNVDGSYGVIVLNENTSNHELVFATGSHSVKCTAPAKSIVSLKWKD